MILWLDCRTVNREDGFEAYFIHPLCLCRLEETVKAVGFFYVAYMSGVVKHPTQGNGENLLWTHRAGGFNLYNTFPFYKSPLLIIDNINFL